MPQSYDLTQLDAHSFEHLVNSLALRVLGAGHTTFGPGADGGRDGLFEGDAPYPSATTRWTGTWYIQSKFHKPHLSKDPQAWLVEQVRAEIKAFEENNSPRKWPDNWIVATNVDPSGVPMTGAFEKARRVVAKARPKLKTKFHIWGGQKILSLLADYPQVAEQYGHFLTPGHVLTAIYERLRDDRADVENVIRCLVVRQFDEQKFTKLDQAGSDADTRPGIHKLFIDLPFQAKEHGLEDLAIRTLLSSASKYHRIDSTIPNTPEWQCWRRYPSRARVWFIKGGPGQGKSTIGQFFCQLQRAVLILQPDGPSVTPSQRTEATEVRDRAIRDGFWPSVPRIPITIDLKEYAQWLGHRSTQRGREQPKGILTYLAVRLSAGVEQKVEAGLLKRCLTTRSWFVVFDGLDEVPQDVKDIVALEVRHFLDDVVVECDADVLAICTSRPQGYSGQFADIDGPTIELTNLPPERALACAKPVVELGRSQDEGAHAYKVLSEAIKTPSVRELMTTPLQSHIMAVVVRDGAKPPDRRWQLFNNFYQVIKRREANKNFPDQPLAKLLREDEKLLKTLHNRLGFVLHSRAETSKGAQTHLAKSEFKSLAEEAVRQMVESDQDKTVAVLMRATTDRLVLVSTPDDGNHLRFDIRPLQEFFAAEFLYESVNAEELRSRIELIAGDAHWREVMHFLFSALVENDRQTEMAVAVEVLRRLNEGDETPSLRLLHRRLARGALISARLLQEGVLEQDRRHRQRFRATLEPLTGLTDIRSLTVAIAPHQTNSREWQLNFLTERLNEADRTENVGAMLTLAHVLPSDDHRVPNVMNYLMDSPAEYASTVICGILHSGGDHSFHERYRTPADWFLRCVIKLLLREDWAKLSSSGIEAASHLLGADTQKLRLIAMQQLGLTVHQSELLEFSIGRRFPMYSQEERQSVDYGLVRAVRYLHDWMMNSTAVGAWASHLSESTSKVSGISRFAYRILRWSRSKRPDDFRGLQEFLTPEVEKCIPAVSENLKAHLPIDFRRPISSQITELKQLDNRGAQALAQSHTIAGRRIHPHVDFMRTSDQCTLEQLPKLVSDYPKIALHLFSNNLWRQVGKTPMALATSPGIKILVDEVVRDDTTLASNPAVWGKLLVMMPEREADLRNAFRNAAILSPEDDELFWITEFHPFPVHLPEDNVLLPRLVRALLRSLRQEMGETLAKVNRVNDIVGKMIDDASKLPVSDESHEIRCAALFVTIFHPDARSDFSHLLGKIVESYKTDMPSWYFDGVVTAVTLFSSEEDAPTKALIGKLLDQTRNDYVARRQLEPLFTLWREASYSPVNRSGVMEKWLAGT